MSNDKLTSRKPSRRSVGLCALLGVLLSLTAVAMLTCVGFRDMDFLAEFPNKEALVACVACGVAVGTAALAYALVWAVPRIDARLHGKEPLKAFALSWDVPSVALASLVVFVLWLPWIVLQYPTGFGNDTYEQLYEFQTSAPTYYYTLGNMVDASFIDHHPVFDTLVFGGFWSIGDALGDHCIGLFAYNVFQSVITAVALAASCCYLERLSIPKLARLLALAFVALFPCIPQYATAMLKDSLFSAVFVPFFIVYIEAVRTRGASLAKPAPLIALIVFSALCILTKKTGFIIVAFSLIVLLASCTRNRPRVLLSLAVPLAICLLVVPAVVYPAIGGVEPGGKQEAFGIPLQQVVAAARENDDLTPSERDAVNAIVDLEKAKDKFASSTVDLVKNIARPQATTQDYLRFCMAYLTIAPRHIGAYTSSAFAVVAPLICPGTALGYYGTCSQDIKRIQPFIDHNVTGELGLWLYKPPEIVKYSAPVQRAYNDVVSSLAGTLVLGVGMFGGWIPLCCIVLSLIGGRRYAAVFAPITVSVLLLLLCPAAPTRYVLPFMYALPLMAGLLYSALACRRGVRVTSPATLQVSDDCVEERRPNAKSD